MSNDTYRILGVMPRGFETPQHADLWIPLQLKIDPSDLANNYCVIARLRPGVSLQMAQADLNVVSQRFRKAYGGDLIGDQESVAAVKYHDFLVGDTKRPLWILLAAVGLMLLIACANVANRLLTRFIVRQREMAVRVAVGASGSQIVGQLLTESVMLSIAGGVCGCLVASACLPILVRAAPANIPQLAGATIDIEVLFYALLVSVITGVLFGFFSSGPKRALGRRQSVAGSGNTHYDERCFATAPPVPGDRGNCNHLALTHWRGTADSNSKESGDVFPGFDAQNAVTLQMSLNSKYEKPAALAHLNERVAARILAIPGVTSVATINLLPMSIMMDLPFEIVGWPVRLDDMPDEKYRLISPKYFATLRIPVVEGREFTERDTEQAAPVLVVNKAFAAKHFAKQNPIGQQLLIGRIMGPSFADRPRRIVGVVDNIRDAGLNQAATPEMFEPEAQVPEALLKLDFSLMPLNWLVRTAHNPMGLLSRCAGKRLPSPVTCRLPSRSRSRILSAVRWRASDSL